MPIDTIRRTSLFVVLLLAQVLVFNHVWLLGYATVFVFVYFVIQFPRNYPRWASLLWAFFFGLCVDLFANTSGMTSAALTLTAFVHPPLLELFVPRDAPETMKTSVSTLGYGRFLALSSILVLLFCLFVVMLCESFIDNNYIFLAYSLALAIKYKNTDKQDIIRLLKEKLTLKAR